MSIQIDPIRRLVIGVLGLIHQYRFPAERKTLLAACVFVRERLMDSPLVYLFVYEFPYQSHLFLKRL